MKETRRTLKRSKLKIYTNFKRMTKYMLKFPKENESSLLKLKDLIFLYNTPTQIKQLV